MGRLRRQRKTQGLQFGPAPARPSANVVAMPPAKPAARTGIFYAVPSETGDVNWTIAHSFALAAAASYDTKFPFSFVTHLQVGTKPVEYARNLIVKSFMASTCEWVLMVDADQIVPANFWQLCTIGNADVVSGLTYTWSANKHVETRLRVNQYNVNQRAECYNLMPGKEVTAPYFAPIVGTGCVAIRRKVFAEPPAGLGQESPFFFTRWPDQKTRGGEDINFSVACQRSGFKVAVHPGVRFGHVKLIDLAQIAEWYDARKAMEDKGEQPTEDMLLSTG